MTDPMNEREFRSARSMLRKFGPILLGVGAVLLIIAFVNFFASIGRGMPKLVWLAFIGLPLFAAGFWMTVLGHAGKIARYYGREIGPAASATFNDIAKDSAPGVRAIAGAVRDGVAIGDDADETDAVRCPACAFENDADARFCAGCGGAMEPNACGSCGHPAKADARFCDECGARLDA